MLTSQAKARVEESDSDEDSEEESIPKAEDRDPCQCHHCCLLRQVFSCVGGKGEEASAEES